MSPNKRIFLNIVATYGRSLYALVIGLFCGRWTLMALGQEDYGLYGVVGGLTVFIAFLNGLLSGSIGRFYALSVGAVSAAEDRPAALEECRKWFSTAVLIHSVVPLLLMAVGWPLGEHAIRAGWIVVPPERLSACLWTFRFCCITCFVSMVSVPLDAMYTAKQYIAELTVYSFVTTTLNAGFLYYMVTHPGVWLARFAAWSCLLSLAPSVLIAVRAVRLFPECRFRLRYCLDLSRVRQVLGYAGWQAFGCFGALLRGQGVAILLNRRPAFGPMRNSSMTVANTLAGQAETLAGSMVGAFSPAVFNAYGAGQMARVRSLAFRTCKFGTLLTMVFALPMLLEVDELLRLWLKEPPVYAAGLCWCVLAYHLIDRTAVGHMLAVNASGRIARYQLFLGTSLILTLPLAWLFVELGWGVYSVGYAMVLTMAFCASGRVWFARTIVGMSARHWLRRVLVPLALVGGASLAAGALPRLFLPPSFARICLTTLLSELALVPLSGLFVLDAQERAFAREKLRAFVSRIRKGGHEPHVERSLAK